MNVPLPVPLALSKPFPIELASVHDVPPVTLIVSVEISPKLIVLGLAEIEPLGKGFTVTTTGSDRFVHPEAFVTSTVYDAAWFTVTPCVLATETLLMNHSYADIPGGPCS